MTLEQWFGLLATIGTWTALAGGFFYWLDVQRTDDIRDLSVRMTKEHEAVARQIRDIADSVPMAALLSGW